MLKASRAHMGSNQRIIFSVLITLMAMLLSMGLGSMLVMAIFKVQPMAMEGFLSAGSEASVNALKIIQACYGILGFAGGAVMAAQFLYEDPYHFLKITGATTWKRSLPLVILMMMLALPFVTWLGYLNSFMVLPDSLSGLENWMKSAEDSNQQLVESFLAMDSVGDLLVNLLLIAVIPAIGEEFFFRGIIQQELLSKRMNPHVAIWLTAILFSAFHLQFYGFLQRMILGVLFGYLMWWSGSIWPAVAAHFTNNGFAVFMAYIYGYEELDQNLESAVESANSGWIWGVGSLAITCGLLYLLKREYDTYNEA
jgi:membrane protease YdiL (CAAX protease family)